MRRRSRQLAAIAAMALAAVGTAATGAIGASTRTAARQHVLLISVDGLHGSDLARWVAGHPNSNLAQLAGAGMTYENARSTRC